jgi:asparagine synthase (glutamine-hydrolysing)
MIMCGIAGILLRDGIPADPALLARMTDVLAHRGPDGEGFHVDGAIGLGHRRLAIIDLDGGAQPMGSSDGTLWITYNGEVYNYRELRTELQARGYTFTTQSDTEVVLRAYEAWDVGCLPRLRGMFAFAIWDGRRRRMLLARDRVGIKPLVYAWDGTRLLFASEIKAVLQDPHVARDLDWDALADYFTYHYIPAPRTVFRAIRKLPPASYLICPLAGGPHEIHRYWDLRMTPDHRVTEREWIASLQDLLDETIKLHTVSDVPVGAFLSGGLDSSTVVACMAQVSPQPIRTFSIGFDDKDFDELAYARLMAARYGTHHFEQVVKPDVLEIVPQLAWQFDEPFADASAVPTYCVSRITREHVTVALSGDGGDESFAGYRRYAEALKLDHQARVLSVVRPLLRLATAGLPENVRGRGFLDLLAAPPVRRYFRMMTHQREHTLAALLTPGARGEAPRLRPEYFDDLAIEAGTNDYLSTLQYLDVRHYLPEDILTKVDRTSMLVSLEARVPLLDHVLMEHVATIPATLKFRAGAGKHILKQAMRDRLPAPILSRPKMGFGVPLGRWLRNELRDFARDLLLDGRARQRGIVQTAPVERLLDEHQRGRRDRSAQIWALVCFELWARTWMDR